MKKRISEKKYQQLENKIWEDFLAIASAEETYYALITSNWDSNTHLLNRIKNNPETDKAIVLAAYWMSEPYFYKQFRNREDCLKEHAWAIEMFDYIAEIEAKYCNGFYLKNTLAFDSKNIEINQETDWTAKRTDMQMVREVPSVMYEKLKGKTIPAPDYYAYTEGLPNVFYSRVEQLFDTYEIVY